jgi:hypothetical protein
MRSLAPDSVAIFYQTDIKRDGVWIDKSHLVNLAADRVTSEMSAAHGAGANVGVSLLWHKIVICNQVCGLCLVERSAKVCFGVMDVSEIHRT